jgi:GPH family glycoside/pentoside/hexuronide:cation symporter
MTFAVPDLSADAKVRYAYVTFTLLGLAYSLVYIPYGALQPMMARDPRDKVRIGSWRAMGTSIASIIVYALVLPVASLTGPKHRPQGFLLAAIVFGVLTVALYLLIFIRCRERFGATGSSVGRPVWVDLRQLAHNPVWWLVFLYATIMFTRIGTLVSVAAYYCKNVLGTAGTVAVLLPLLSVAILAGGSTAALLMRRFGMRRTNIAFLLLAMALHLLMPRVAGSLFWLLAVFMAANIVIGVIAATVFISCTDAVEYQERRFGSRIEGLVFASVSFATKFGMALGTALTAYALAWAGYDPNVPAAHATRVIGWLFYDMPIALMGLQLLCMAVYRPITPATATAH